MSLSLWRCIIDRVKALIVAFLIGLCNTMGANVFQDGRGNFQRTLNSVPIIYLNREGLREQSVHLINNKFVNFLHKDPFFFRYSILGVYLIEAHFRCWKIALKIGNFGVQSGGWPFIGACATIRIFTVIILSHPH